MSLQTKSTIKQRFILTPLLLLLTSIGLHAAEDDAEKNSKPAKDIQELSSRIETILKETNTPGAAISIVDKQGERLVAGFGDANVEEERKASAETLFRIGSVSKMFVALAALQLQEKGLLDLNAKVSDLVPDVEFTNPWEETDPVRVVHLLEHTAGWDDIHLTEFANNDPSPLTLKQGLAFHPHSRVSRWRPGERMSYSNSGPPVVAYIIESITGESFEDYVQKNLFDALDMSSATYRQPQNEFLTAALYSAGKPVDYWHILMRPSGAVNASARDMAKLLSMLIHQGEFNGERILSKESLRRMERPTSSLAVKSGMTTGYGLANYTSLFKNFVFHGHNGGVEGGIAELAYENTIGVGYSIILNSDKGETLKQISQEIKRYITFGHSGPKRPETTSLDAETVQRYDGYYLPVNPRQQVAYFMDPLTGTVRFQVSTDKIIVNENSEKAYFPINNKLLRQQEHSRASMALLEDDSGPVIQQGTRYFQKIAYWKVLLLKSFFWLFLALIVAHLIWFWIWLVRRLMKSIAAGPATRIRIPPFIAALSVVLFMIFIIVAEGSGVLQTLGNPTMTAWLLCGSTLLFALASVASVIACIRYWQYDINIVTRYFCALSSFVFFVATAYLLWFGVIGLRTFA
ncbi:serine hydrolase [Pleionea litopenaei]|uniref:Serine hydrolase n=1 Tax=Pleionea litopenaei TaxID=3070815 RepID=A0AA51RRV3_9GAMM|nr:serine hydrolase [Pleionea sp. HL-JVS1]WMS86383.1 serine hydrolase [Pleionea sp. HL-JVS1]